MFRWSASSRPRLFLVRALLLSFIAFLLVACGGDISSTQPGANPTPQPVNGFGTAANHVHSLLVLPSHILVLATHYGLFRSQDGGTSWQEVAGGSKQQMDGLMTYSLAYSPLNPQRLYVLTQPSVIPHYRSVPSFARINTPGGIDMEYHHTHCNRGGAAWANRRFRPVDSEEQAAKQTQKREQQISLRSLDVSAVSALTPSHATSIVFPFLKLPKSVMF
jgi:hypothetical protein